MGEGYESHTMRSAAVCRSKIQSFRVVGMDLRLRDTGHMNMDSTGLGSGIVIVSTSKTSCWALESRDWPVAKPRPGWSVYIANTMRLDSC